VCQRVYTVTCSDGSIVSFCLVVCFFSTIRFQLRDESLFTKETADGESRITAYFQTPSYIISRSQNFEAADAIAHFNSRVENYTRFGSGYSLSHVKRLYASIIAYTPLHARSFVPTPVWIETKKAVINVQNLHDNKCFLWSVLAALHLPSSNFNRVGNYSRYEYTLNMRGISYPVPLQQIPLFEKNNSDISINVLGADNDKKSFTLLYRSKFTDRPKTINLLLIESETDNSAHHFVLIRHLSRLLHATTGTRANCAIHTCLNCFNGFSRASALESHKRLCTIHPAQEVKMPPADKTTLEFDSIDKMFSFPIFFTADFESYLQKETDGETNTINNHSISSFCLCRVSDIEEYRKKPIVFSGEGAMEKFFECMFAEALEVDRIMSRNLPIEQLTEEQTRSFLATVACPLCKTTFSKENPRVKHHCHITSRFLYGCCNTCNLKLRPKVCRRSADGDNISPVYDSGVHVIPVLFHAGGTYDTNFILKNFDKKYTRYTDKSGRDVYDDVKLIPISSEKSLVVQIANVVFLDSRQFMNASLSDLVQTLRTADGNEDKFFYTSRYAGLNPLFYEKAIFPYTYWDGPARLDEAQLPPKSAFFNDLTQTECSDEDYERAKKIWDVCQMSTMRDYCNFYVQLDVLLLSDVIVNFRDTIRREHALDCLHYVSLPGLALDLALKVTGVKIELMTDMEAFLMVESALRGGLAYAACRYSRSNHPGQGTAYNPALPTSQILYLDACSLYASAQTFPLPVGDFRFLTESELASFDLFSIGENSPVGYFLDVNLIYPDDLHETDNDFPMCPESLLVTLDDLSPTQHSIFRACDERYIPSSRLINNLYDKQRYVVHHGVLQFYVRRGMKIERINRIVSFKQLDFMAPFVAYCNEKRRNSSTEFEVGFWKLLVNACYGKFSENLRKRENLRLISDRRRLFRATNKPMFVSASIINSDLVLVRSRKARITLTKPLSISVAILDWSKLIMYSFFYDCLKAKFGSKLQLLYTDTDSLIIRIESDDVFAEMSDIKDRYLDTSNFDRCHPLFSERNKRRLGCFKFETGESFPDEIVALRAKMYSIKMPENSKTESSKRAKGIPKAYVNKTLTHESYLNVLRHWKPTYCRFNAFRSRNHHVTTRVFSKRGLSSTDTKRYLLSDFIHTLAFGHKSIRRDRYHRADRRPSSPGRGASFRGLGPMPLPFPFPPTTGGDGDTGVGDRFA